MQFLLLIHGAEGQTHTEAEMGQITQEYIAYSRELQGAGVMQAGAPLMPSAKGAKVTVRESKQRVVDGPFTEAKEVLGGFYMVEVATLADAIAWAAKCPGARYGTMEVREVRPFPMP
jgi:hypothetical protein